MRKELKETLTSLLYFVPIIVLYFHVFLFSLYAYKNALEFPLFVVFPSMWLCYTRILRYMPTTMHMHMRMRKKTSNKHFASPAFPPVIEALIWYPVIALIYWHLNTKIDLLNKLQSSDDLFVQLTLVVGGYGAFFIASGVGGIVSLFVIENMSSLKQEVIPKQWKLVRNRLSSVFIAYAGVILLFSGLYRWVSENIANSFSVCLSTSLDSIYFSVVTITTLGYGDVTPTDSVSKVLVMVESLLGVLFLAIMIGLVISTSLSKHFVEADSDSNKAVDDTNEPKR